MAGMTYPKRLIEVDLPIKRISAHSRREKSIQRWLGFFVPGLDGGPLGVWLRAEVPGGLVKPGTTTKAKRPSLALAA
jgi:hypothetical protein